jgi:murein DD-endopeptidase MepM/ murein hydrolase activator NlpD
MAYTWREVSAPDLNVALRGYQTSAEMLNNALAAGKAGLKEWEDRQINEASNALMADLMTKYQGNPDALAAAAADGSLLAGYDPRKLRPEAIAAIGGRVKDLQEFELGEERIEGADLLNKGQVTQNEAAVVELEQAVKSFARKEGDWASSDALQPLMAAMAGVNDENGRRAIMAQPEYAEVLTTLRPEHIQSLAQFGHAQALAPVNLAGEVLRNQGQGITNNRAQWEFTTAVRDDKERRTVQTAVGSIISTASTPEEVVAAVNSNPNIPTHLKADVISNSLSRLVPGPEAGDPLLEVPEDGDAPNLVNAVRPRRGQTGNFYGLGATVTSLPGASRDGGSRAHAGWDLAGMNVGAPVAAPMDGEVVSWKPNNGKAGNMITVRYANGKTNTFMHLAGGHKDFKPGTRFRAGQVIAYAGNTGNASTRGTNRAVLHVEGSAGLLPMGARPRNVAQVKADGTTATRLIQGSVSGSTLTRLQRHFDKTWTDESPSIQIATDLTKKGAILEGEDRQTLNSQINSISRQYKVSPRLAGAILAEAQNGPKGKFSDNWGISGVWNSARDSFTGRRTSNINYDGGTIDQLGKEVGGLGGARTATNLHQNVTALQSIQAAQALYDSAAAAYRRKLTLKKSRPAVDVTAERNALSRAEAVLRATTEAAGGQAVAGRLR